jgi:hypothetical protein
VVGRSVAACGRNRLIEHDPDKHGKDMSEIPNWKWSSPK